MNADILGFIVLRIAPAPWGVGKVRSSVNSRKCILVKKKIISVKYCTSNLVEERLAFSQRDDDALSAVFPIRNRMSAMQNYRMRVVKLATSCAAAVRDWRNALLRALANGN